jgi:hypothetical protein
MRERVPSGARRVRGWRIRFGRCELKLQVRSLHVLEKLEKTRWSPLRPRFLVVRGLIAAPLAAAGYRRRAATPARIFADRISVGTGWEADGRER